MDKLARLAAFERDLTILEKFAASFVGITGTFTAGRYWSDGGLFLLLAACISVAMGIVLRIVFHRLRKFVERERANLTHHLARPMPGEAIGAYHAASTPWQRCAAASKSGSSRPAQRGPKPRTSAGPPA